MLAIIGLYFPHCQFLTDSRGHVKTPGSTQAMYSVVYVGCVCICVCGHVCASVCGDVHVCEHVCRIVLCFLHLELCTQVHDEGGGVCFGPDAEALA